MVIGHKFSIGDRIYRIVNGIDRHGTVIEVSQSYKNHLGEFLILYSVQWDDSPGKIEKGYMDVANGLMREETKLD